MMMGWWSELSSLIASQENWLAMAASINVRSGTCTLMKIFMFVALVDEPSLITSLFVFHCYCCCSSSSKTLEDDAASGGLICSLRLAPS